MMLDRELLRRRRERLRKEFQAISTETQDALDLSYDPSSRSLLKVRSDWNSGRGPFFMANLFAHMGLAFLDLEPSARLGSDLVAERGGALFAEHGADLGASVGETIAISIALRVGSEVDEQSYSEHGAAIGAELGAELATALGAEFGPAWLDAENLESAEICLHRAKDLLISAYRRKTKPSVRRELVTSAKDPGRRPGTGKAKQTADRNRRLAAAYDAQLAAGLSGKSAFRAIFENDRWLKDKCEGMRTNALYQASRRGREIR